MDKISLTLPLKNAEIKKLRAGQIVSLSGALYTARDAAHKRFAETLAEGKNLPFDLTTAAIYYAGPAPAKDGEIIGSVGPTTSSRMDSYTPALVARGLKVMIGKGKRSPDVTDAIKKHGAVYFAAVGGAGALYQACVKSASLIAYPDLGCEAVYCLTVENFPVVVATDADGNTILK